MKEPILRRIKKYSAPIRRKLHMERWLNVSGYVLVVGALLLFVLYGYSRLRQVLFLDRLTLYTMGAVMICLLVVAVAVRPSTSAGIKKTDRLLSRERLMTAVAFSDDLSEACQLQRDETIAFMESHSVKEVAYPWTIGKRLYQVSLVICLLTFAVSLIRTPSVESAEEVEAFIDRLAVEEIKLEDALAEAAQIDELTEGQKKALEEAKEALKESLKKARSEEEAVKALAATKNELKELSQQQAKEKLAAMEKELDKLKEKAEAMKQAQEAGEKASDEEQKKMQEMMEALKEALDSLSEEELAALAEQMQMTEASMEAFEEALAALEAALAEGDFGAAMEQMASMNEMLSSASAQMASAEGAVSQMLAAINSAGNSLSSSPSLSQIAFAAAGQGQMSGTSQSASAGGGAGAAPNGSTNSDTAFSEEQVDGAVNKHEGEGGEMGEYEAINESEHLGGTSDPSMVSGEQHETGETTYTQVKTIPTESGELVGYSEVYADYHQEAMERVDTLEVPVVMKEIVRDYFTGLNEEN